MLGAPISTILMVFELTGDYATTVAVMIATVVASTVTQQVFKHSYFTWQLALRGLDVRGGREQNLLRSIRVATVMASAYDSVAPTARLSAVGDALQRSPYGEIFVVEESGILRGTVTLADLAESAFDTARDAFTRADDAARHNPPVLTPADTLDRTMSLMESVV